MTTATQKDILRIFPSLPDHAVAKIEDMQATVSELDAAMLLMSSDDVDLIDQKEREGDRFNHLLAILSAAGVEALEDDH